MSAQPLGPARPASLMPCPLYGTVAAGFPSPAQDYAEQPLDLNQLCIPHPAATYFVRVAGDSMRGAGLVSGDLLVVDRALEPRHGQIVIAAVDGEFLVKRLQRRPRLALLSAHPDYPPLYPDEGLELFGVVTHLLRSLT